MIKLELSGIVEKVSGIKPLRTGFSQTVILHQPGEEYRGVSHPDEHFVIQVYSTSQTDSRFLQPTHERKPIKASVYLKGERWVSGNRGEYNYNHKLNLKEWQQQ